MKYAVAILIAASGLLMGSVVFEGGPNRVVYPPHHIPIRFTHDYHTRKSDEARGIKGEGLACTFCHDSVSTSSRASDRDIPGHGSCDSCHAEWIGEENAPAPAAQCAHCHKVDGIEQAPPGGASNPGPGPGATSTAAAAAGVGPEAAPAHAGGAAPVPAALTGVPAALTGVPAALTGVPAALTANRAAWRLTIPRPNIKFPHKTHVDHELACTTCHTDVPEKQVATREDWPTMDRCIACHERMGAPTACKTCHYTQASGRVVTDYPEGKLMPERYHSFAIHDADFLRDHAVPAERDKAYCATCHGQEYCLRCHDGAARDVRYHPGDWISMHGVRAKTDDFRCQSCHRLASYCVDCHVRTGVASVSVNTQNAFTRRTIRGNGSGANFTPTGPHPMGDAWMLPTSKNFHGFFAQRNIKACASCHQEQFCILCHGSSALGASRLGQGTSSVVGGPLLGSNPHGANPERLRGSTAAKNNVRMCLKCHSPTDPNWR